MIQSRSEMQLTESKMAALQVALSRAEAALELKPQRDILRAAELAAARKLISDLESEIAEYNARTSSSGVA